MRVMSVERCYSDSIKGRYGSDRCGEMLLREYKKVGMGVMSVERCYSDSIKGRYGSDECGEMLLRGNIR